MDLHAGNILTTPNFNRDYIIDWGVFGAQFERITIRDNSNNTNVVPIYGQHNRTLKSRWITTKYSANNSNIRGVIFTDSTGVVRRNNN